MAELSENDKKAVERDAKEILEEFSKEIMKVKVKSSKSVGGVGGFRDEKDSKPLEQGFREIMFLNAPKNNKDCIIAEKSSW